MRAYILGMAAGLLVVSTPARAQLRTFCLEGAQYTCVGVQLITTPVTEGTRVTLRLANLEGANTEGVISHVPWSRLYGVAIMGPVADFGGSWLIDADPQITTLGAAESAGRIQERWFLSNIAEPDGNYRGYALATPNDQTGAEIIGCTLPPAEGKPYFRTCDSSAPGAVEFSFRTEGTWEADEAALVITLQDKYARDMSCMIGGKLYDDPEAYHCLEVGGTPPPPPAVAVEIAPNTISLSATSAVSVYLYSTPTLDAGAVNPATTRLRVIGGGPSGAPVATRNGAYMTSVRDFNGDGRPDRLITVLVSALRTAGLSTTNTRMQLEDTVGSVRFTGTDATPPTVTP